MKKFLIGLVAIAVVLLSVFSETDAHDYSEVKAGKWRSAGDPQCEGYNLNFFMDQIEQDRANQSNEYRFSQSGDRVVVTLLERDRPRITVLGEVSEEYIHFEYLEATTTTETLAVWSVEILEDEEELEYTFWVTAHYAHMVLTECTGLWFGTTCYGNEYVTGVPNFSEGYRRYSVECTGTLEWVGD